MQQNKYLDMLGIKIHEYGTNFCGEDDKRSEEWEKQRKEYGFDSRECWNLDKTFIEWLYSHLKMYLNDASGAVDLSYHVIEFEGENYTQEEAIRFMLEHLEKYLQAGWLDRTNKDIKDVQKATRMWAEVLPLMWW